jgi:hypothetical protein
MIGTYQFNRHRSFLQTLFIVQFHGSSRTFSYADTAAFTIILIYLIAAWCAVDYTLGTIDQTCITFSAAATGKTSISFFPAGEPKIDFIKIISVIFYVFMPILVRSEDRKVRKADVGRSHQ